MKFVHRSFVSAWGIALILLLAACNSPAEETAPPATEASPLPTTAALAAEVVTDAAADAATTSEEQAGEQADEATENGGELSSANSGASESTSTSTEDNVTEEVEGTTETEETINLGDAEIYPQPLNTNYYFTMAYATKVTQNGTTFTSEIMGEGYATYNPTASEYTMTISGEGLDTGVNMEQFAVTTLSDTNYFVVNGECILLGMNEESPNPYEIFVDAGGFLNGEVNRVFPNQTINGQEARVYRVDRENIQSFAVSQIYDAWLYVSEADNSILRIVVDGVGRSGVLTEDASVEGEIHYELNIIPTTDQQAIEPPAACAGNVAGGDGFPAPADAAVVMSGSGTTIFTTSESVEAAANLYKDQMPAAGYTLDSDLNQAGVVMMMFSGSDGSVQVMIAPDTNTGNTQIMISEMP